MRDLLKIKQYRKKYGEYWVDQSNNNVIYRGYAENGATGSQAKWIIERESIEGTVTKKTIAPYSGLSDSTAQVWNDRASLFAPLPWSNSYSTIFPGVNSSVSFGDFLSYERTQAITFSFWARFDNVTTAQTLFSKRSSSSGTQINLLSNGRLEMNMVNTITTNHLRVQMASSILPLTYYNIVFTYDGSSLAAGTLLYLNSAAIALTAVTNNLSASILNATSAYLGQFLSGQYFTGKMDEVTIWNKALTAAEVLSLYNGGDPMNPASHSAAANLVHYYKMGDNDTYPAILDNVVSGAVNGTMLNMSAASFSTDVP